jgi:hypothetical protein
MGTVHNRAQAILNPIRLDSTCNHVQGSEFDIFSNPHALGFGTTKFKGVGFDISSNPQAFGLSTEPSSKGLDLASCYTYMCLGSIYSQAQGG